MKRPTASTSLAAEVIAMARIEAGKLHLEKQPVAVADLVAAALERGRLRMAAPGNSISPIACRWPMPTPNLRRRW